MEVFYTSLETGKFNLLANLSDLWLRYLYCEIAHRLSSLEFTQDKSTLVQVMAWCSQATSQYLSQCWLRSMLPHKVIKPQWVNIIGFVEKCNQPSNLAAHRTMNKSILFMFFYSNSNKLIINLLSTIAFITHITYFRSRYINSKWFEKKNYYFQTVV